MNSKIDIIDRLKGIVASIEAMSKKKIICLLLGGYLALFLLFVLLIMLTVMDSRRATGFFIARWSLILCITEDACLHEVGHWVDKDLERPSRSEEFTQVIDELILNCSYKLLEHCWMAIFPGVYGNDFTDDGWGGYSELYAAIYSYDLLYDTPIPTVLEEFYKGITP